MLLWPYLYVQLLSADFKNKLSQLFGVVGNGHLDSGVNNILQKHEDIVSKSTDAEKSPMTVLP